jgi:NADPH:quinone reductase
VKAVVLTGAGGNEVVKVMQRGDPAVADDEVLVDVAVAGLNPADLQQREGRYPAPAGVVPDVPGLEVAGSVVEVGAAVTRWSPGDRVFGLVAGGGLASRVSVHERSVTRVPERLEDREAAAIPEVFITAHDALTTQGAMRAGETVLVQGASGAVGCAALQIARGLGAEVVMGVVRSDRAAGLVRSFGAEPIDAATFAATVLERTDGRGVDVVLELVGGSNLRGDLDVLALRGRIVVVSVATGSSAPVDLLRLMVRRASIHGTVLRARPLDEKAAAVEAFTREAVPLLEDGRARAIVDSVFAVEDVTDAFDRLAEPGKEGKVLVSFA